MALSKSDINLLELPDLVKENICIFLDQGSLLNFRLTCKVLKAVAERPLIFAKLSIKITISKQLQIVMQSGLPFNNFILHFVSLKAQSYFGAFTERYASTIRILNMKTSDYERGVLLFLRECTQLQELTLEAVTFEELKLEAGDELTVGVLRGLSNLRKLFIQTLRGSNFALPGMKQIKMFFKILSNCRNLREFSIPYIESYAGKIREVKKLAVQNDIRAVQPIRIPGEDARARRQYVDEAWDLLWENWENDDNSPNEDPLSEWNPNVDKKDIVIHSIIDYINSFNGKNQALPLKKIHLNTNTYFLWHSFKDFISTCYQKNVQIYNMDTAQLLDIRTELARLDPDVFKALCDLRSCQIYRGFPFSSLVNLKRLFVELLPIDLPHTGLEEKHVLAFPNLESLKLKVCCYFCNENLGNALLIRKLFKDVKRPTVKTLEVQWSLSSSSSIITAHDVTSNFPNLRELSIEGWDSLIDDDYNHLWENLPNLEKVSLKYCQNLTNRAFFGKYDLADLSNIDQRPFNRLKKLHTLMITDKTRKINEIAIAGSLSYMNIRHFEFCTPIHFHWQFYDLLSNSNFGKSVEYLSVPIPFFHPVLHSGNVMRKYENIKQCKFIPGPDCSSSIEDILDLIP